MGMDRHIWEGWTVRSFIDDLEPLFNVIMSDRSWSVKPFETKDELAQWCKDNQPYYKKHIPEVVTYFWQQTKLRKQQ